MKKIIVVLLLSSVLLVAGCEKVSKGDYKEGVYYGTSTDSFGGSSNVASAVVTVDKNGKIISVFVDTTYTKDGKVTTKKALKEEYGMKVASPIQAEWYEQMEDLEAKVVADQGLDNIKLNADGKTDSISTVTIKIDAIYSALENALKAAK